MAFPAVAATNTSFNGALTSHTLALPTGIASGDLLIAFFSAADAGSAITWPSGWTQLYSVLQSVNDVVRMSAAYRVAAGTEGASITVTTALAERSAHNSYRITGQQGTPVAATAAGDDTAAANPPNLAPSWGAADTLWLAAYGCSEPANPTAPPTNYTDNININTGGTTGSHGNTASARRQLNAASEDPGAFTHATGGGIDWVAATIAVQPVAETHVFPTRTNTLLRM